MINLLIKNNINFFLFKTNKLDDYNNNNLVLILIALINKI